MIVHVCVAIGADALDDDKPVHGCACGNEKGGMEGECDTKVQQCTEGLHKWVDPMPSADPLGEEVLRSLLTTIADAAESLCTHAHGCHQGDRTQERCKAHVTSTFGKMKKRRLAATLSPRWVPLSLPLWAASPT
jgi:hypothetical protein